MTPEFFLCRDYSDMAVAVLLLCDGRDKEKQKILSTRGFFVVCLLGI